MTLLLRTVLFSVRNWNQKMIYWYNLHIFGTSKKKKVLGYVVVIFCQERCSESIIQCRNVKELLNKGKTKVS